ncbi:hypothetical protein FB451DRAFT_653182 [Mycena latifolia]|nr:hypothetical protein FB451DRAFT_653182 [Mycena latifolia]
MRRGGTSTLRQTSLFPTLREFRWTTRDCQSDGGAPIWGCFPCHMSDGAGVGEAPHESQLGFASRSADGGHDSFPIPSRTVQVLRSRRPQHTHRLLWNPPVNRSALPHFHSSNRHSVSRKSTRRTSRSHPQAVSLPLKVAFESKLTRTRVKNGVQTLLSLFSLFSVMLSLNWTYRLHGSRSGYSDCFSTALRLNIPAYFNSYTGTLGRTNCVRWP